MVLIVAGTSLPGWFWRELSGCKDDRGDHDSGEFTV
jgi:hypothetical protein